MELHNEKFVFNKQKFDLIIIQFISLILSFIFGSILFLVVLKYLNNINILNTFLVIICVYFFQLIFEFIKYFILFIKFNNLSKSFVGFMKNFKPKFLVVNFCFFILFSLIVFGCLLGGLFFSNLRILFIFIMGILLGVVFLIYTHELIKLVCYKIFEKDKHYIIILVLVNALFIILLSNIFYLFKYLSILVFVFINLVNLFLFHINYKFLTRDGNKVS